MSAVNTLPTTVVSLLIALAVVISGTHAKDFATLTLSDTKKVDDPGSHIVKITTELHNHVDKVVKVQQSNADSDNQADSRSLRLLHDKKESALHGRIAERLRLWWQLNTLYLS